MANSICHIEIPCRDLARAKAFYGKVFNWTFQDVSEGYAMFDTGEGVGGGLDLRTEGYPTEKSVTIYVQVEDIVQSLKAVADAGGKTVQEKTKIGDEFGFYALLSDTEGNQIGLWSKN
jgi:predicted enzyme related to lactoylglutathione lyase